MDRPSSQHHPRRPLRDDNRRHRSRSRDRDSHGHGNKSSSSRRPVFSYYEVVKAPPDEKLGGIMDDPRGEDPTQRITKKASSRGTGYVQLVEHESVV